MSRANEWAKLQISELRLREMGGAFRQVFMVTENGKPGMRIDNSGPFNARESLRLARWILYAFRDKP